MAYPTGWGRRCELKIASSKVSANLSSFPVLLNEDTLPSEMFDADGSYPALNGGGDIRFSSDEAGDTQLPCEVVSFVTDNDPANGTAEIWVKVASVSSSADTSIYVWYKKSGETQPAIDATYGAENVWRSEYKLVSHDGGETDSTSGGNDGTAEGGVTGGGATGQIGVATTFDGSDDGFNVGDNAFRPGSSSFSLTTWAKTSSANRQRLFSKQEYGAPNKYFIFRVEGNTGYIETMYNDGLNNPNATGSTDRADGNWHYFAMVRDNVNDNIYGYVDKTTDCSEAQGALGDLDNESDMVIGRRNYDNTQGFVGEMDEVRYYFGVLSKNWIDTEYNNQSSPSTFASSGSIQTIGTAPPATGHGMGMFFSY